MFRYRKLDLSGVFQSLKRDCPSLYLTRWVGNLLRPATTGRTSALTHEEWPNVTPSGTAKAAGKGRTWPWKMRRSSELWTEPCADTPRGLPLAFSGWLSTDNEGALAHWVIHASAGQYADIIPFAACVGPHQSWRHGEPDTLSLFCLGMGRPCQDPGLAVSGASSMLVDTDSWTPRAGRDLGLQVSLLVFSWGIETQRRSGVPTVP